MLKENRKDSKQFKLLRISVTLQLLNKFAGKRANKNVPVNQYSDFAKKWGRKNNRGGLKSVNRGRGKSSRGKFGKQVGGQGVDRNIFQNGGLVAHNKLRQIHGTPPMKLNTQMCDEAEAYAKVLARKGTLKHAKTQDGENLAYACSSAPDGGLSGPEATKRW